MGSPAWFGLFANCSFPLIDYSFTCGDSTLKDYTRVLALDALRLWSHNRLLWKVQFVLLFPHCPQSHFTHAAGTELHRSCFLYCKNSSSHCISERAAVYFIFFFRFSCSFCPNLSAISTSLHLTHNVAVSLICIWCTALPEVLTLLWFVAFLTSGVTSSALTYIYFS